MYKVKSLACSHLSVVVSETLLLTERNSTLLALKLSFHQITLWCLFPCGFTVNALSLTTLDFDSLVGDSSRRNKWRDIICGTFSGVEISDESLA